MNIAGDTSPIREPARREDAFLAPVLAFAALLVLCSGCVSRRVAYNPTYLSGSAPQTARIQGQALLLTDPAVYHYEYAGRPDSFHGGGTTLVLPLGQIVCETALRVLGGVFTEGCVNAPDIAPSGRYAAIVRVRPLHYEYAYNQLRNLTMAITPQVRLSFEVVLMEKSRTQYFSQVYDSGMVNDKTTLDTLRPAETINKHTHRIVEALLLRAAADIQTTVSARASQAPARAVAPGEEPLPAPADSRRRRLAELKKLYEEGLITKEAYEQKQAEILKAY